MRGPAWLGKLRARSYNHRPQQPASSPAYKRAIRSAPMLTTRVRDLMRPILITCPPGTALGAVAATLTRQQVHAIIVADATGTPLGVVSDIDLLARGWLDADTARQQELRGLPAAS